MFIYLRSIEARTKARTVVKVPNYPGEPKVVEFRYGLASVDPALGNYMISRNLATHNFKEWGMSNAHGVTLANISMSEASAI